MRFMVIIRPADRTTYEQGGMPEPKLIEKMMKFNEELAKAGVLLALDGLHPSAKGARIKFADGKRTVVDGPFTETRELIGGYWLWQCKSKEEAVEWASRCPALEGDELEIRQVFDAADFGPEVVAKEGPLLAEIGKNVEENKKHTTS